MLNYTPLKSVSSAPVVKPGTVGIVTALFVSTLVMWESSGKTPLVPYKDVRGVVTVCDGITDAAYPGFVKWGKQYTRSECSAALKHILDTVFLPGVSELLKHEVTNQQYLMLVDFAYNAGLSNLEKSTLLKKVNQGQCLAAGEEFKRWVYSGGQKYPGLVKRAVWRSDSFKQGCSDPVWISKGWKE